jgi:hypothetical protein
MTVTGHKVVEMGYTDVESLVVLFSVIVKVFVAMTVLVVYAVVAGEEVRVGLTIVSVMGQIVVDTGTTVVVVYFPPSLVVVSVLVVNIVLVV